MQLYRRRFFAATAGCLVATVAFTGSGAAAATAAPRATSSVFAVQVSSAVGQAGVPAVSTAVPVTPVAPAGSVQAVTGEKVWGSVIRALVAAFKSIGGLWTKVVNAVKAGYAAFLRLWSSIPTWIKNITGGLWTVYEIWQALKDYIF